MKLLWKLGILVCLVGILTEDSRSTQVLSAKSTAVEIIRAAIEAHGGKTFHNPRTLQLRGRATYHPFEGGPDIPLENLSVSRVIPQASTSARDPNGKIRIEAYSKGKLFFREGFDGKAPWSDISEEAKPISEYLKLDRHFGFGIIRFAETEGFTVERLTDGAVEGRPAYHVAIVDLQKRKTEFWIDKKLRLVHKVEFDTPSGHHERFYWPYDPKEDIREAHHVRHFYKGHKLFDVYWEKISYNLDFPDNFFLSPLAGNAAAVYQLAPGNQWNYTAPANYSGDYVSRMAEGPERGGEKTIRHFDATKAAKLLSYTPGKGLYYLGEEFSDGKSVAEFDQPILWFPETLEIGTTVDVTTGITRRFTDGTSLRGTFALKQKITRVEDVTVTAGVFRACLRVEWDTAWDLGDGRRATSENVYHYAPGVGVVKASARFIILGQDGKQLVNRLVETDLKHAFVGGKKIPG